MRVVPIDAGDMPAIYHTILADSLDHLASSIHLHGLSSVNSFPSRRKLDPLVEKLSSIYRDGAKVDGTRPLPHAFPEPSPAQSAPATTEPSLSCLCCFLCKTLGQVRDVQIMQLGSKEEVRAILAERAASWDDAKLDSIRKKDALWAWAYSRYFYRGGWTAYVNPCLASRRRHKAERLYLADLRETAMMVLMVRALRSENTTGGSSSAIGNALISPQLFDDLFPAYTAANKEKYSLMMGDMAGLARVINALVMQKAVKVFGRH